MKQKILSFCMGFVAALALSCGVIFCLVTSFDIPMDALQCVLCCLAAACLFSAALSTRRSWIWIGLLFAAAAILCVRFYSRIALSASVFLHCLTESFALAIPWVQTVDNASGAQDATLFLALIGTVYALLGSWAVLRRGNFFCVLMASLLPLVLCLTVLEFPPAGWAVLLVLGSLVALAVTQLTRNRSVEAGNRLLAVLLVPLCMLIGALALVFPENSYVRSAWSDHLQETVTQAAEKLPVFQRNTSTGQLQLTLPAAAPVTLGRYIWDRQVTGFDLSQLGPQRQYQLHVMRVKAPVSGVCHLRGTSFGVYEEGAWSPIAQAQYEGSSADASALLGSGVSSAFEIETDAYSSICYTPYRPVSLPQGAGAYYDAYIRNPENSLVYSVYYADRAPSILSAQYQAFVRSAYTQLPEQIREQLRDTAAQISSSSDTRAIAEAVRNTVRNSAQYSLQTQRPPAGEDPVVWFLHESETGYCVHFASAAAVLLRMYGIPARLVTGYLVQTQAEEWVDVTSDDAHAWVEYFVEGEGWCVLDPTPEDQSNADEQPHRQEQQPEDQELQPENTQKKTERQYEQDEKTAHSENDNENDYQKSSVLEVLKTIGKLLLIPIAAASVLSLWNVCIRTYRKMTWTHGSSNRRAIAYYRHIRFLAHLLAQEPSQRSTDYAEKARYSPHRINDEELSVLVSEKDRLTEELLQHHSLWKRIVYRFILAL